MKFVRNRDGILSFVDTREARDVAARNRSSRVTMCQKPELIHQNAVSATMSSGGKSNDRAAVLGHYKIQFGIYRGQPFSWMLENCLGYSAWIVHNMRGEKRNEAALSVNKFAFKEYMMSFPDGVEAIQMKAAESDKKRDARVTKVSNTVEPQKRHDSTNWRIPAPVPVIRGIATSTSKSATSATVSSADREDMTDDELFVAAEKSESAVVADSRVKCKTADLSVKPTAPTVSVKLASADKDFPLPQGWGDTLSQVDHQWISMALFRFSTSGKPELKHEVLNKLWWYPPQPTVSVNQFPGIDRYFAHRLIMWMPRRLWRIKIVCSQPGCENHELTSAGLYRHTRQVLDLDTYYNMATEYLECAKCKRKLISWSPSIVQQLDIGHRTQFPAVLTYKLACDMKVVRLLRQRSLGNSSTQLQRKLEEQHGEVWLQKTIQYMTDCQGFMKASSVGMIKPPVVREVPPQIAVPTYKWLLTVYSYDVLLRLDMVKASITSTFGCILKMDSTKKVVKKVAGEAANTAAWATNVGNEYGQVLMSVLTASEGSGLGAMVDGLINRYSSACVDAPELLYVDRDCCGESSTKRLFSAWPDIEIRLDIWHFMRRFSAGVTTDAHRLYGTFMSGLSQCIFQWDQGDVDLLKSAKSSQMKAADIPGISAVEITRQLGRKELALHCRRRTRGVEETTRLLRTHLEVFDSAQGCDVMGVPLLDHERIWNIWESQKQHINCIQDPDEFQLYTKTGSLKMGTVTLPTYRCGRGSTSLESFHLHLNRFIPGTSASGTHFQAYLLEGLHRWNEDRIMGALKGKSITYNSELKVAANKLGESVFRTKLFPDLISPRKYTGEKIGMEYLYAQTGQVLQDLSTDPETPATADLEDMADEDEGFNDGSIEVEDQTVPLAGPTNPRSPKKLTVPRTKKTILPTTAKDVGHQEMPPVQTPVLNSPTDDDDGADDSDATDNGNDSEEEIVGSDAGYNRVDSLAEYLVQLHNSSSLALSNIQATKIVKLWNQMLAHDKAPTQWPKRYKPKLTTGRFKASKTTVAPGVESTRRCFLGQNTGPAQNPNCNRYVEAIIIHLCEVYPCAIREGSKRVQRWSLVLRAYKKIREMVLNSNRVMQMTSIQLFEINQATLNLWFIRRSKNQEKEVLQQGLPVQSAPHVSTLALPPPMDAPTVATFTPATAEAPYVFVLPTNTAGEAGKVRVRQQRQSAPNTVTFTQGSGSLVTGSTSGSLANTESLCTNTNVPYTTLCSRKRKLQKEQEGKVFRKYVRKATGMICSKCKKERTKERHKQHYGNWFCADTSTATYDEWMLSLASKGYGKRKKTTT